MPGGGVIKSGFGDTSVSNTLIEEKIRYIFVLFMEDRHALAAVKTALHAMAERAALDTSIYKE